MQRVNRNSPLGEFEEFDENCNPICYFTNSGDPICHICAKQALQEYAYLMTHKRQYLDSYEWRLEALSDECPEHWTTDHDKVNCSLCERVITSIADWR